MPRQATPLRRPVVLGEDERGEIDLAGELDEPVEGRDTRVEDRRPRLDVGDVLEPPGERLEQLLLLPGRPEEDSRLHRRPKATAARGIEPASLADADEDVKEGHAASVGYCRRDGASPSHGRSAPPGAGGVMDVGMLISDLPTRLRPGRPLRPPCCARSRPRSETGPLKYLSDRWQHFVFPDSRWLQPVPLLARLAAEVDPDVRLVTTVMIAPVYPPVLLAEELATLDIVSEGRLIVGLGAGYMREEYAAFGVPFEERFARLEECIARARGALDVRPRHVPRALHDARRRPGHDAAGAAAASPALARCDERCRHPPGRAAGRCVGRHAHHAGGLAAGAVLRVRRRARAHRPGNGTDRPRGAGRVA